MHLCPAKSSQACKSLLNLASKVESSLNRQGLRLSAFSASLCMSCLSDTQLCHCEEHAIMPARQQHFRLNLRRSPFSCNWHHARAISPWLARNSRDSRLRCCVDHYTDKPVPKSTI